MAADADGGKEERFSVGLPVGQAPSRFRLVSLVCSLVVAGIGLFALFGWLIGLPLLASLGSGMIPVAPSTAVLFVLYAIAVFLRVQLPSRRGVYWTGFSINSAGALIALLLLIMAGQGIRLNAEHLGFAIINASGGIPRGHMSPVSALCFLLASLSFLASLLSTPERPWRDTVALWFACLLITISSVLVLAYLYGEPLFYGGPFIPPAVLTSVAFMALGTALFGLAGQKVKASLQHAESTSRASYAFILIFIILAVGIVTAGYLSYRHYENNYRLEIERQLSAVADMKADELVQWRKERLGDAAVLYKNFNFSELVKRYLDSPENVETRSRLQAWLRLIKDSYEYDQLFLLDAGGIVRMSVPEEQRPISSHVVLRAAETLETKQVAFQDFYRNERDQHVYLAVLVPVLDGGRGNQAIGVLVVRIDPGRHLYPSLERWPIPSGTAETLLVRREGNDVLFLNELRFQKNTALNLRRPLDQKDLPAAQAVMGRVGIMKGRDYRGVPVIAELRAVPDSPWFLVARMDVSEVFTPLRERLWIVIGFVVVLLFGTGAAVGLVWRQQSVYFYRKRHEADEALHNSEERLRKLNEELEQRVRERTAQLETVNKELEGFSYSVSHDLRAPLRHITGFAELLIRKAPEGLDEKSRHYLDVISESARQMGRLVDDLLSFSRMGRAEMLQTRTNLDKIVEEAMGDLKSETRGRDIEWKIGHLPEVYGDPVMLKMVVVNLISNAIKFTRLIPRAIIEVGHVPDVQDEEIFYIRDNGAGFDMKYADKLFGLFQRLHRPEEFEGTGLGLANVRRIISRHGGRTWADGALNKGAAVYFSLPKYKEP